MANKRLPRLLTAGAAVMAMNGGGVAAEASAPPPLRFVAATGTVTLERYSTGVYLDLPTHVVAGAKPFEIRAKRASYADPIVATQGTGPRAKQLPTGLITSFSGFTGFTHLKLVDGGGTVVLERDDDLCPNNTGSRTRPDAPDASPYPQGCSTNPFALGSVWGIQAGWSAPTSRNWWESEPVDLAEGTYTATITVNPPYVALFGIPADQASTAVQVIVRPAAAADERGRRQAAGPAADPAARPAAERPAGAGTVPAGPRPDLRSLPAWGIKIGGEEGEAGHDYLAFNATVWAAGRSPLVVDGFRRDENMMDAYQYFYDAQGNQTGYAQVGTMQWDPREGHQ